jgi:hypothetical protein
MAMAAVAMTRKVAFGHFSTERQENAVFSSLETEMYR